MSRPAALRAAVAALAGLLALVGCDQDDVVNIIDPDPPAGLALSGRLTALDDGRPVAGAAVAVTGTALRATTDAQGEFALEPLSPGEYGFTVRGAGLFGVDVPVVVGPAGAATRHDHVHLTVPRRRRDVTLAVVAAADRAPVAGVPVALAAFNDPALENITPLPDQPGLVDTTDADGLATLTGLPATRVRVVVGASGEGGTEDPLAGTLVDLDLRQQPAAAVTVALPRADAADQPRVLATNISATGLVSDPLLWVQYDGEMAAQAAYTYVEMSAVPADRYDVRWATPSRLEIVLRSGVFTTTSYRIIAARLVDGAPRTVVLSGFLTWQAEPGPGTGTCGETVGDLALDNGAADLDFDSRRIELAWTALTCADGYAVYARDDHANPAWVEVDRFPLDFETGTVRTTVELPATFDRFAVDGVVTPLAGTAVELCVLPTNPVSPTPGAPHPVITVRDVVPPAVTDIVQQSWTRNDGPETVVFELLVRFSEFIADGTLMPLLEIRENGGDPDFVLDAALATWTWAPGQREGVFRIPLEPGQDASGDQLRVSVADLADISGNVAAGVWSSAWQRLNETFRYDFEAGPQGWTVDGSGWEWGAPLSGPGAAHSGRYCWATGLDGNYVNGMNASLVSPSVLLPEGEAELSIAAWYETETCCDVGYVEIDAGTGWQAWQTLRGSSGGWQILTFGLGEYGGRTLRIRFRFLSDGSASYPGLYIDDVVIGNPTPNASGRSGRTEARE